MQLEHSFSVPVPVEEAWRALLDPERVAPCFPGATLAGVEGSEFSGTVKVRMGPISLLYKGTGRFTSVDDAARRVVLEATGKDSRGNGTASATVTATLTPSAPSGSADGKGGTTVGVITDLTITGRPAQLGRGLIGEVSGKILNAFADCLATRLADARPADTAVAPTETAPPATSPQPPSPPTVPAPPRPVAPADEIDLLEVAGQPVLKRLIPVAAGALALLLVLRWLRRRS
jgi:uncharacterized protein